MQIAILILRKLPQRRARGNARLQPRAAGRCEPGGGDRDTGRMFNPLRLI
jgi:hypothetical protein